MMALADFNLFADKTVSSQRQRSPPALSNTIYIYTTRPNRVCLWIDTIPKYAKFYRGTGVPIKRVLTELF